MAVQVDTNWQYRGLQVVRLENELLRVDVLPEAGSKVYNFVHTPSGRNLLWHNPHVPPARQHFGACFDDNWSGGWDELIPNDLPVAEPEGDLLPDHGEYWSQAAKWDVLRDDGQAAAVRFAIRGRVLPVLLEKTLTLEAGASHLHVHYRLTNQGPKLVEFDWNIHPAMAITPDSRLDVPVLEGYSDPWREAQFKGFTPIRWPYIQDRRGAQVDLRRVEGPASAIADMHYLTPVREGWWALTDQRAKVGFGLAFPKDIFPHVWLFRTFGGWRGLYTLILEASNGLTRDLGEARKTGVCGQLAGGASLEVDVTAVAYSGAASVARIDPDGTVAPGPA
jgi:hypothetical protein